jgi:tetratricopeptide (TPR) repeat protein
MALQITSTTKEILNKAREAEINNDLDLAAEFYEKAIKANKADEDPYDRLMVIYRKLKQYKDELRVINSGIKFYENLYKKKSEKLLGKNKKLLQLSNALAKTTGLTDKKGNSTFYPEPIGRWRKRKAIVEKKI